MSRNEDIVEAYYAENGRNVPDLAKKHRLWPEAIYAIVAAGGAEIDLLAHPPEKRSTPTPMLHRVNAGGWKTADLFRKSPGRPRADGQPHRKITLTSEDLVARCGQVGATTLASELGVTRAAVYQRLNALGYGTGQPNPIPRPAKPEKEKRERGPRQLRASGGMRSRFVSYKADPQHVHGLADNHPAVVEGRTLFPTRVVGTMDNPRFLVSGHNNPKVGRAVEKGVWAGMPIYTLTLEERATCPRTCHVWNVCYGNGMPWPRRADAKDPDFIPALACEVVTVARQHPGGFVVRLHVLGDFFSASYVKCWGMLMDLLPGLHVWGYTARRLDDPLSAAIAAEVQALNDAFPDRWVVRTSHTDPGPGRTIVVDSDPNLPDVIVCPAETEKTAACATCGICWAPAAHDKTVAFLRHGLKTKGPQIA